MNIYDERVSTTVAILGTLFTWMFGSWDTALMVLICFVVMDYIMGLIKGYVNKELSSNTGFRGIAKKSVIFIVLIMAVLLDRVLNNSTWVFRTLVCYFYVANEGLSILENCCQIGIKVPVQIQNALEQLRDKEE